MYKTHRQNHDFQIAYFLAGACHTPDGAYSLLCDLLEDRETALKNVTASQYREEAKRIRAQRKIDSDDEAEQLEGKADFAEIDAFAAMAMANIEACKDEIAFIKHCMDKLEPLRKFSHLPLPEAHEAAQFDEWKLELIHRAENYLLTTGTISPDHFVTMRMHPAFVTEIMPAIERTRIAMSSQEKINKLLTSRPAFDVNQILLESKQDATPQLASNEAAA